MKINKSSDASKTKSIFAKCGYSIEYNESDVDYEEEYEEEYEDDYDEGYFWQDNNGEQSEVFNSKHECIEDCLENLDTTGVVLTKLEAAFLAKYQ